MTPEQLARKEIDGLLTAAGWHVCSIADADIRAARGVAIREFPLRSGHGFADYLLYLDGRAAGVIEAKKVGVPLIGVERQAERYATGLPDGLPAWQQPLPFAYESTGVETRFTSGLDPEPRSRPVFAFHRPETLATLLAPEDVSAETRWGPSPHVADRPRNSAVVERDDFWATTSNKQLNFVQHIKTLLKPNGHAAVVVPDNVLFEGGAGETIRRKLMHECDVHTLLRLPTGLFYAQGVKANVIFFDKKPASETPWTRKLWIYDLRTNKHFTLKTNPLKRADLDDFVALYNPTNRHDRRPTWSAEVDAKAGTVPDGRWRVYDYEELIARDKASLDIFWLRDDSLADSDNLPPPAVIAREIIENLEAALEQFRLIEADLSEPMQSDKA